jgi:flavin-dependent dehydrogenase
MTIDLRTDKKHLTKTFWDVIVVGAGPAGAMAALELARRQYTVLLVDRAEFPRGKVCGCCLNGAALATLRDAGLADLTDSLAAVSLRWLHLKTAGRSAIISLPGGVSLSREALDSALIDIAMKEGVTFLPRAMARLGETLPTGRVVDITTAAETIPARARVILAADGLGSRLASGETGPAHIASNSYIGAGVTLRTAHGDYPPGTIHMAVGQPGYVGLVRLEDGRLDLAAALSASAVRAAGGPGVVATQILRDAGFPAIAGLTEAGWKGTPPLTRTPKHLGGEHWLAIGDAAGYVEPFTGEGIAWALACGRAVAPVVDTALSSRDWSVTAILNWERVYQRSIRRRQTICRLVSQVLRRPWLCRVAIQMLAVAPWLAAPVTVALNRRHSSC